MDKIDFETKTVHAGQRPDPTTGSIVTPIYATATYVLDAVGKDKGYQYSRTNNPTRTVLENLVASLEGSTYGVAFATGMAAADAIIRARLKSHDHIIVCDDAYGGIYRLFEQNYKKFGLKVTYVDTRYSENVQKALLPETRMVWLETPTNPLLKISDIEAICQIIEHENKQRPTEQKILSVVDNTFMTPYFFKPLNFGVDIVLHSTTKFLSGHTQLVGGICVIKDSPNVWYNSTRVVLDYMKNPVIDKTTGKEKTEPINTVYEDIKFIQNAVGAVPGSFDCWLTIMGIKTLAVRMQRHEENARKIVDFLSSHEKVAKVYYPGLPAHINYNVAKRQYTGFGAMISFELKGGLEDGIKTMNNLRLWSLAESLGAVESLVVHPASMTHASIPRDVRLARGISDGLIRLSVGIESVHDLIADLQQALDKI